MFRYTCSDIDVLCVTIILLGDTKLGIMSFRLLLNVIVIGLDTIILVFCILLLRQYRGSVKEPKE
jgi:hypothetical protein